MIDWAQRQHEFRGGRWESCRTCNMPEGYKVHVKPETKPVDFHDNDAQAFRLDRPDLFAYRVLAYLSRYGGTLCWPDVLREVKNSRK